MQKSTETSHLTIWIAILVAASIAFSFAFACATPFVALAAIAALTLPRKAAFSLIAVAWIANQMVGYVALDYPQTANSYLWGIAIAASALFSLFIAQATEQRLQKKSQMQRIAAIFATSFIAYEVALFTASLFLGGTEDFTIEIIGRILLINICAFAMLQIIHLLNASTGFISLPAKQRLI